ncbi:MAG: hypothetical protein ACXVAU_13805 [Mucilaginibacter sp.]
MQKNLWQILWALTVITFTGILYFLSVVINCPMPIVIMVAGFFGFFTYRWLDRNIHQTETTPFKKQRLIWSYIALIAGIIIITNKIFYLQNQYGEWDSWWLWNYHARFLNHDTIKYLLYQNKITHPDYPLLLPGIIAFFWQLFHTQSLIVPYIIAFCVTLIIPIIIYLDLYRRNLIVAAAILILLAIDEQYIQCGLYQYADMPLGLLFLCTFICVQYANENKAFVTLTAMFLGCCIWTKNEGIMLSLIFIAFHFKTLFTSGNWKNFLAGFLLPLIVVIGYKIAMPATDIIGEQNHKTLTQFLDATRYKTIWEHLGNNINSKFFNLKIGVIIYAVICFAEKRMPDKNMFLLLACLVAVFFVYVFTTKDLEWHLNTSMDRVLFQLMPAFTYVIGIRLCKLRFSISDQVTQ